MRSRFSSKKLKAIEAERGPIGIQQETFAKREKDLVTAFSRLGDSARVLIEDDGGQYHREMIKEDILILANPLKEVNDNIVFISLSYLSLSSYGKYCLLLCYLSWA